MRLWTWQNRVFDITDGTVPVDTLRHSEYLNSPLDDSEAWKKIYEQLWKVLGTSQILWCHTEQARARGYGRSLRRDHDLWELEVEDTQPLWKVCSMAWNWILTQHECWPPSRFEWLLRSFIPHISGYSRETFSDDFNLAWKQKPLQDRWQELFYNDKKIVPGCTDVVLPHPVNPACVVQRTPADQVIAK